MLASEILRRVVAAADATDLVGTFYLEDSRLGPFVVGDEADLTTPATYQWVPTRAGYYFVRTSALWLNTATAGTASTPPTLKAGNNGSNDNIAASQSTPGTASHAAGAPSTAVLTLAANQQAINLSTPINLVVTVGATGTGLTWRARPILLGYYLPVGDL